MPELLKVEFAKTNFYLEKMGETFWVIDSKERCCRGGGLLTKVSS